MSVVFVVFVDLFRKPLILLTFLDFWLVDRLWFLRVVLWFCGSLVVFGSRVAHCVSETGKARKKPRAEALSQGECVSCARSALRVRWLELRPRTAPKTAKSL